MHTPRHSLYIKLYEVPLSYIYITDFYRHDRCLPGIDTLLQGSSKIGVPKAKAETQFFGQSGSPARNTINIPKI